MLPDRNPKEKHKRSQEFGDSVKKYVRGAGYFQKNLAEEINLNEKVLSRKLRAYEDAYLTEQEVWRIIITLAKWHALLTQDEVLDLLKLAQMDPHSINIREWQKPPLNQLTGPRHFHRDVYTYVSPSKHNLPARLHSFIGREEEIEQLQRILRQDEVRLVTLIGSGGSGKTSLALYVANELVDLFTHGIWFVPLAAVSDAALVTQSIMQCLNIKPTSNIPAVQRLITYLQDKQLLLILDNFEHLAEVAPVVSELLTALPDLKVLVTSRVVLDLYGEHKFNLQPLHVPAPAVSDITEIGQYDAVQLFVERARAVQSDFALTPENAESIAQICARVDGLPLALELAAARIDVLPPELLLAKLSEARLPVLTGKVRNLPERHRTLHKTITWSYNLLSSDEQTWFAHLGVFNGGWSLEAAEAMMQAVVADQLQKDASVATLELIEHMVDNSLLVRLPVIAGQPRFLLLETLREYALGQLSVRGEYTRLRDWHASYYLSVVEDSETELKGPRQLVWLARLRAEQDNIRAAISWALQRAEANAIIGNSGIPAIEVCLRMAAALRPYWEWQGDLFEGRGWFDKALKLSLEGNAGKTALAARAKALGEAARLVCLQNEQNKAVELAEESIALWRQLDDPEGLATALWYRGWPATALGNCTLAKSVYEQALQLIASTDNVWLRAQLLFYRGAAFGLSFEFEPMHSCYDQSMKMFEQVGDKSAVADLLKDQGGMTILERNYPQAIINLVKSIEMSHELGHKQFVSTGAGLLAFAIGLHEEPDPESATLLAAKLWGIKDGMMDVIGSGSWLEEWHVAKAMRQQILSRVDEARWRPSWEAGRALTEEQVVELCRTLRDGQWFKVTV